MVDSPPFDPRLICNALLDKAAESSHAITNLSLQKLLYFSHSFYLIRTELPLVSGYFEAWQYGPVNPVAFHAFKAAGADPIAFRAVARNPLTGAETALVGRLPDAVNGLILQIVTQLGGLTAGRLVEISHAPGAPWRLVVEKSHSQAVLGLRISDELILSRFRYHKVRVNGLPFAGEPGEDAPFDSPD